ncbi:MAG: amidohydrolase [Candidatus Abyssobacteria bacterium SURF_5]|uniref:Amidohydrolase n=1 Tax=Abyssobacteria bacterium (strain SURF_5) TaxID=2093360 RepID=A0A3A4NT72_ABYX5|nr:MAG: amidohydrolase [Candidatus Abyssubacteria bacterium SURF_5]
MIVDSHVHLFFEGSDPESFFIGAARAGTAFFNKKSGQFDVNMEEAYDANIELLSDKTGEKLVQKMDEAGIDKAILLPLDFWLGCPPSSGMSIEEKNALYAAAVKRHAGRLLSHVGVDPRRPNALDIMQKGVEEGAIGLKLHPTAGFYPDDPICAPLYRKALEYDIPVLIHSGNEPAPLRIKFSQPKYIDTVAAEFPDLKIIIAHTGHGWWQEAIDLASVKPNVYVDFAGWQMEYLNGFDYFYQPLRFALDTLGPWRILFGTDGLMLDVMLSPRDWVLAHKEYRSPAGIRFDGEEIDIILGHAAARLYNLSD